MRKNKIWNMSSDWVTKMKKTTFSKTFENRLKKMKIGNGDASAISYAAPKIFIFKGDGVNYKFYFPRNYHVILVSCVIHTRGGVTKEEPKKITPKYIAFDKPPQKGNKITAMVNVA